MAPRYRLCGIGEGRQDSAVSEIEDRSPQYRRVRTELYVVGEGGQGSAVS
ncbi:hypothetical protein chiPu_0028379, partial [Chiloscyllium punctatum]|nr:hypothetical protein [Chiloscyllium punctatum]